jgi:hypothetical protein
METVRTAPRSPWQNAYTERVIGSIRRECLDHVVVVNAAGLHRLLTAYIAYYMESRTLWLAKTPYALRRLRLHTFSDSLDSWRLSSSRCSTRFGSSPGHGFRCTSKSSRSDTSWLS